MDNNNANSMGLTMAGGPPAQQPAQEPHLSEQDMLEAIVQEINRILTKGYTLVDFDGLTSQQLLQVVSDVFGELSPQAGYDFSAGNTREEGAMRLMEFLMRTLGYKVAPMQRDTFPTDFVAAEKTTIYPVLFWVLKRKNAMKENRERVYLAKFLMRIEVPDELKFQDGEFNQLYERYLALRQDFIEVHKRAKEVRETSADPAQASRRITTMENEKMNLNHRIESTTKKLVTVSNQEEFVKGCKVLRKEQDDSDQLNLKSKDMNAQLQGNQRRLTETSNRLREVRRNIQDGRLEAVVQRMQDDLHSSRLKLDQELPDELAERKANLEALTKLQNEPFDLAAMNAENASLVREIQHLEGEVAERNRSAADGTSLTVMKGQTERVQKKKTEGLQELNAVTEENSRLMGLLREKETEMENIQKEINVLKGDDFKNFSERVRKNTQATQGMRVRLQDLRGEFGILDRSETLLRGKQDELMQELKNFEAKHGQIGYFEKALKLEDVTRDQNAVQKDKGQTLEELSFLVQELVNKIGDQRKKLAPQIISLRDARSNAARVEEEWLEKKSQYEYQEGMLMSEVNKLSGEVDILRDETQTNETLYHRLNCQLKIVQTQLQRVADEKEFRAGNKTLDGQILSFAHLFHRTTEDIETKQKGMQKRRVDIDENHDYRLQQVEYFSSLKKILLAKKEVTETNAPSGGPTRHLGNITDSDIAGILGPSSQQTVMRRPGADVIIFEN